MSNQPANQPATNRPLTTADVAPPGAVPEGVESPAGGRFRLPTDSLRAYTMIIALLAIWLFFQWKTVSPLYPYGIFLHPNNFSNLLQQMAVTGVLAVGMLLVIVAGQIDLSVGSVVGARGRRGGDVAGLRTGGRARAGAGGRRPSSARCRAVSSLTRTSRPSSSRSADCSRGAAWCWG